MILLNTLVSVSCAMTVITNKTNVWNTKDEATLQHAKSRCAQLYSDAPCLTKFIKKDALTYQCACGAIK